MNLLCSILTQKGNKLIPRSRDVSFLCERCPSSTWLLTIQDSYRFQKVSGESHFPSSPTTKCCFSGSVEKDDQPLLLLQKCPNLDLYITTQDAIVTSRHETFLLGNRESRKATYTLILPRLLGGIYIQDPQQQKIPRFWGMFFLVFSSTWNFEVAPEVGNFEVRTLRPSCNF